MNLVIFSSEAKGLSSLNGIIEEANNRGINIFVMVCQDTQLRHPTTNRDKFQILTNCDTIDSIYSDTLGVQLPFKPDWLIINRERWEPELSIIKEFKQKFNTKIGIVEPNAYMLGNAENNLEIRSKNRFKDIIDVFFIHSTQAKNIHLISGFEGNMVITGNPKYDINFKVDEQTTKSLKEYYNVDDNKKQVLLFSLINQHRDNINTIFKDIIKSNPDTQYFYKPYPGEPWLPNFKKDFYPSFFLDNCTPIINETDIWGMFDICDEHIGCMSSIIHATLLKNKKYRDLSLELKIDEKYLDSSWIYEKGGVGIENDIEMWVRSFGLKDIDQLKELLPISYFNKVKILNQKVWNNLNSNKNLLTVFDDFNDFKASKRIINYILEHEK
tara:strand:- start:649 stop:1800 length:1152 start_codon:yes stop_codon:yes gene_type:complete